MTRTLFAIFLSLILVGCATQQTRFGKGTNFKDDAYLKSGAQNIQIISYIPSKAEILGTIKTERCNNNLLQENASFDDLVNDLKVEAFKLGANYIYDVHYVKAPVVGSLLRNCWSHVSAYAIAYKVQDLSKNDDSKNNEDINKNNEKPKFKSGTAFFINNQGNLITNEHVIESCKEPQIIFKGKKYSADIVSADKKLDLALIKTNIDNKNYLKIYNNEIKQLQKVVVAGYPLVDMLGIDLKFTSGIVSSLNGMWDANLIQIDAALNRGNSGGPIVDEKNGSLVAVAVSGLSSSQGVNFGIKNTSLLSFLNANKTKSDYSTSFSLGGNDILKILEESTVLFYCEIRE
jgi:S1-C subfamily serine protease